MKPIMTSIILTDDEEEAYFTADEDEFDNESYYTAVDLSKEAEDILLLDEILTSLNTLFETELEEDVPESKEEVPEPKEDVPEPREEIPVPKVDVPGMEDSFLMKCLPLLKMNNFQQKRVPIRLPEESSWSPFEPKFHPPAGHPAEPVTIPGAKKKFKITSQYYESFLEDIKILGRGAFAEAVLLRDNIRKCFVVDKILYSDHAVHAIPEAICLDRLSGNPHFLTYLGHFVSRDECAHIFMDYFDGKPMMDILHQIFLGHKEVQTLLSKLGHAMRYMHSKEIIHMDIKPDNILVNQHLDIKIIDFNLSKTNGPQNTGYAGTVPFIAPEVQANKENRKGGSRYGYEADYHSLGITAFFMGVNNLRIDFQETLLDETKKRLVPFITALQQYFTPDGPSDEFHDLILGLLHQDPSERLNDEKFLDHPFFKKTFQPSRSLPAPEELRRLVKALKKKWYKKGPVCTKKSKQFQQFMKEKEPACEMASKRLGFISQSLEKKLLPPQKKKEKQTNWDKIKAAFRPKKECQEAPKPPAQETKGEKSGKKKKKGTFPWIPKVFRKKQNDPEKSKPAIDHGDEFPVEDGKPKRKSVFKGFFKKKGKKA